MKTVGERVKWARKRLKLSQTAVRQALGIGQSTLSELENGESASTKHLPALARLLGVNAYWLQTGLGDFASTEAPDLSSNLADADRRMCREMGGRITRLRERKGMSHEQLGRPVADAATIRSIEAGTHWPGPTVLDQIALRLSTSTDWLIRGDAVDTFHSVNEDTDLVRRIHDPVNHPYQRVFS